MSCSSYLYNLCVTDTEEVDYISIAPAPDGLLVAVVNGKTEIRSSEIFCAKNNNEFRFYVKFSNECELTLNLYGNNIHTDSDYTTSTFAGRFMNQAKEIWGWFGDNSSTFRFSKIDTINKIVSGVFTYRSQHPLNTDLRLSQGSFTNIKYVEDRSNVTGNCQLIINGETDTVGYITWADCLVNHPDDEFIISLFNEKYNPDNGDTVNRASISMQKDDITIGVHDLLSSQTSFKLLLKDSIESWKSIITKDSLLSGVINITLFDFQKRILSASFTILTKKLSDGKQVECSGSFTVEHWTDLLIGKRK